MPYSVRHVVTCFDTIYEKQFVNRNHYEAYNIGEPGPLHFVFIGDSRIRQLFFYFLKVSSNNFLNNVM
jgi:hypothetical protein